jgi:acyl carrier protein
MIERSFEEIVDWLVDRIAKEMKVAPNELILDETFFNIGMNSLSTLIISGELAEFLELEEFNPSMFWDYPSIQKLAEHLTESLPTARA